MNYKKSLFRLFYFFKNRGLTVGNSCAKMPLEKEETYMLTNKQQLLLMASKRYYEQYGITDKFDRAVDAVLRTKNPELCFKFALFIKEPLYIKFLQEVVLKSENPKYCYNFACMIKGANIEALQQVVLDSRNLRYCCNFASNVRGADVPAFQKIVEDSWSTRYIYRFLMYVEKANKLPLCEFMIVHGNIYDNLRIKNAMPKIYKEAKLELEKKSQQNSDTKEM